MKNLVLITFLFLSVPLLAQTSASESCGTPGKIAALLYKDDFSGTLDQWVSEFAPNSSSTITINDQKLLIDVAGGATAWFKEKLSGNLMISYKRKVIMNHGKNDRLSDLNQFWMASDPKSSNIFTRNGIFSQYDGLLLYYAGIGGNTNSTTRFRKYAGNGERVLLTDLTDKAHLLEPNKEYSVQITVYNGCSRVLVDGNVFFSYQDPNPLREGYFGFRTTQSRQEIDDFMIYRLE